MLGLKAGPIGRQRCLRFVHDEMSDMSAIVAVVVSLHVTFRSLLDHSDFIFCFWMPLTILTGRLRKMASVGLGQSLKTKIGSWFVPMCHKIPQVRIWAHSLYELVEAQMAMLAEFGRGLSPPAMRSPAFKSVGHQHLLLNSCHLMPRHKSLLHQLLGWPKAELEVGPEVHQGVATTQPTPWTPLDPATVTSRAWRVVALVLCKIDVMRPARQRCGPFFLNVHLVQTSIIFNLKKCRWS